ncbi:HAMP domain-containing protein, partial [bacterium]
MRRRIFLALATLLFIFLVGSIMAAVHVLTATRELEKIMSLHQVDTMRQALENSIRTVQVDLYAVNTPISRSIDKIIENVEIMETRADQCQGCHHREELAHKFVRLSEEIDHYKELLSSFLTSSSNSERVTGLGREAERMGSALMGEVEELSLLTSGRFHRLTDRAINRINNVSAILLLTLAATMMAGLLIAGYLLRELMSPLNSLIEGTRRLREGELGYEMPMEGPPEFREVSRNFNEMSGALNVAYRNLEKTNRELSREIVERNKAQAERDNLGEQLLHARKMEAVGTLSGGIAHEFNNLLQVISGSAELLSYQTQEGDSRRKQIETIVSTSRRGADLTRRLLAFSRRVEGELRPLDLNAKMAQMVQVLAPTLPEGIEIVLDLCGEPAVVKADSGGLEQIVLNLAMNARDAMPGGGKLIFRSYLLPASQSPLKASREEGTDAVVLEVSDTGHGMDEKTLQSIFDPFFTTKEVGSGTGLGLSVTYG